MEKEREHFRDIDRELQESHNSTELIKIGLYNAWESFGMACKVDFWGTATALLMTIMLANASQIAMTMSQESKISAGQRREPRRVSFTMG
jgi:hypothetical protein